MAFMKDTTFKNTLISLHTCLVESIRPLHLGTEWRNFSYAKRVVILIPAFFPPLMPSMCIKACFSVSAMMYIYHPYYKRKITPELEDMNFNFSWQEKYCSCHENVKFISSRHRVMSSMYFMEQNKYRFAFAFALGSLNPLFDDGEFRSQHVQRAFQYLKLWESAKENLDHFWFVPGHAMGDYADCLETLTR